MLVEDADSRHPIPRARVAACGNDAALRTLGLVLAEDVLSDGVTDASGVVHLERPKTSAHLLASADGYLPATEAWSQEQQVIVMQRGAPLSGHVVDKRERGIEGAIVRAFEMDRPHRSPVVTRVEDGSVPQATTNAAGEFQILVDPAKRYHLLAFANGYAEPAPGTPSSSPDLVDVTTPDVRLHLDAIRAYRIQLVHGHGKTPVRVHSRVFAVLPSDGVDESRILKERLFTGSSWITTFDESSDASVFVGAVRVSSPDTARATLLLAVPGFADCSVLVKLHMPHELADSALVQQVELRPAEGARFGSVLAAAPREQRYWAPGSLYLYVTADTGGDVAISGERRADGRWLFNHVPAGIRRLTLYNHVASSTPVEVDVQEGVTREATFEWQPPTGVCFTISDAESSARLFDAEAVLHSKADPRRALVASVATRAAIDTSGNPVPRLFRAEPGDYVLEVAKLGYGAVQQQITVEEGRVSAVGITLRRWDER